MCARCAVRRSTQVVVPPPPWHSRLMSAADHTPREPRLGTPRLVLRPWRPSESPVLRELWSERDPRVPPHRRIGDDGSPTVEQLAQSIPSHPPTSLGLLAVELAENGEVIGYCGLADGARPGPGEPELAFELLRRHWDRGYATEASHAVLGWARSSGHRRLWATVWDWNSASRRVLAKLGFSETGSVSWTRPVEPRCSSFDSSEHTAYAADGSSLTGGQRSRPSQVHEQGKGLADLTQGHRADVPRACMDATRGH